jgi:alpha-tubulin suppressor-like RCC1 family protein
MRRGAAQHGQLGHGDAENQTVPKLIESLRDVVLIAAGVQHSVALTHYGELYAWGSNDHGQLGLGNTNTHFVPTRVRPPLHHIPSHWITSRTCVSFDTFFLFFFLTLDVSLV